MHIYLFPPSCRLPRFFLAAAALGLSPILASSLHADETLFSLSDVVVSGEGQNVFTSVSANTFNGTTSSQLVYNNGSGSYFVAKFPETVSLTNVGDKITFDWTVAVTNGGTTGGQAFRVGLFDVGSATDSSFGASTGYRADYGSATNNRGFYERTKSNGGLFTGGAYDQYDPVNYASGDRGSFSLVLNATEKVTFSGTFSIELLEGSKVRISTALGTKAAASIIDNVSAFTAFNSVAIWVTGSSDTSNSVFSNLTVSRLTAVPEPSSVAAWLSGLLAFAGIMIRRRRQREL
ncbi:MAG: PEP-CTERM sorting domain-containing protein [Opitutaceae bacterium]|jgi:hypothetical protein|nr:PEP-CTERM sorting domain-containing protein [Opitutaceae bacterium]